MASITVLSSSPLHSTGSLQNRIRIPSASLSLLTGSRTSSSVSLNALNNPSTRPGLLHCSFVHSSSLSFPSSFSGLCLGLDLRSKIGQRKGQSLVVRAAKKYQLCQTKRNRSRKSLARTHGFRRRMRTTSGRALIKRRRAKGRKVLCPKSNPNSGKRA